MTLGKRLIVAGQLGMALFCAAVGLLLLSLTPRPWPVPPQGFVLENVHIKNPGEPLQRNMRIVVEGDMITSIEKARPGASGPYDGHVVMPGLVDWHFHYPPRILKGQARLMNQLLLRYGVTTVRVVGAIDDYPFELREEIEAGREAGPRILTCGRFIDGPPGTWPGSLLVSTEAEARAAVRKMAKRGADCIKVYDNLDPDLLTPISEEAHLHGLPVVGHIPRGARWSESRIDDIQHLCGLRCTSFREPAQARMAKAAVEHGVAHTPTLVAFRGHAWLESGDAPEGYGSELPWIWRKVLWNRWLLGVLGFGTSGAKASFARATEGAQRLASSGVELRIGSDPFQPFVVPGRALHGEIGLPDQLVRTPLTGRGIQPRSRGDFMICSPQRSDGRTCAGRPRAVGLQGRLVTLRDYGEG